MVVLVVAGCSSPGSQRSDAPGGTSGRNLPPCPIDALRTSSQPVEVIVWHTQQAKPGDTITELANQYNASQNKVRVRLESQGSSYEEIQRKFNSAVASKQLPGVLMVDDTFTQSMADSGVVLPAQSCIDADHYDMSGFAKTAVDYFTVRGAVWPASANLGNVLLFYNRDHFRRAGLDPDKPPTTLAEVRAASEGIKAAGIVDKPLVHEFSSWKTEFWLTGAHSPAVVNDNGRGSGTTDKAALEGNERARELFQWFAAMQSDGLLQAIPSAEGQINQYLAMAQQQASMLVESSSAATSVEAFLGGNLNTGSLGNGALDTAKPNGLDISAGPFPGMVPGSKTQMGAAAWYITNTTPPEVQAAAWDFLKFMNTAEAQAKMFTGGSYLPYLRAAADEPSVQQAFTSTMSGRWLKIAYDEVLNIDPSFPGPLVGPYDQFREAVRKSQDALMFSGASPDAALHQAQQDTDSALAKYNREVR